MTETTRSRTKPLEDAPPEVAAIEADIERTREDLAQTVDQLAARLDVKTRVRARVIRARDDATLQLQGLRRRATDDEGRPTPATLVVAAGVVATAVAVVVVTARRRR
jgi:hypothetical protein